MTPEQIEKERSFFEAWATQLNNDDRLQRNDEDGGYEDISIDYMWNGWLAAKEQERKKNQWHKVYDGVPYGSSYPQDKVLIITKYGEIYSGYFDGDAEAFCYDLGTYEEDPEYITHWRKLPEPPKD